MITHCRVAETSEAIATSVIGKLIAIQDVRTPVGANLSAPHRTLAETAASAFAASVFPTSPAPQDGTQFTRAQRDLELFGAMVVRSTDTTMQDHDAQLISNKTRKQPREVWSRHQKGTCRPCKSSSAPAAVSKVSGALSAMTIPTPWRKKCAQEVLWRTHCRFQTLGLRS